MPNERPGRLREKADAMLVELICECSNKFELTLGSARSGGVVNCPRCRKGIDLGAELVLSRIGAIEQRVWREHHDQFAIRRAEARRRQTRS